MCSGKGSAMFPCFKKRFFLQRLMLKSITGVMGRGGGGGATEFSHIFPPQYLYQEMQLPAAIYHHCTAARRDRAIDTVTNLHLNPRTVWNIFQMAKSDSTFTYFHLQGKTIKNHYFCVRLARFLNNGHLTGQFAQTFGRGGLI